MTGVLVRKPSKQCDTPRGLGSAKASVLSPPICSFLKETDDVDVIDVTTWSKGDEAPYIAFNVWMTQDSFESESA